MYTTLQELILGRGPEVNIHTSSDLRVALAAKGLQVSSTAVDKWRSGGGISGAKLEVLLDALKIVDREQRERAHRMIGACDAPDLRPVEVGE